MNTEQRAIELLASMYDEMPGFGITARLIRDGLIDGEIPTRVAVSAIIRALSPPASAAVVPEGWVMVPKVPTDSMLDAALSFSMADADFYGNKAIRDQVSQEYAAMLAATPSPPVGEKGEG